MNCVYLYENLDKKEGARFYIGSKIECSLIQLDNGLSVIVDNKSGNEYYGSSSNQEMKEDMERGDRFTASLLCVENDREEVRSREQEYLVKYDVANSIDYYNLTNNALYFDRKISLNSVSNFMGELSKDYAQSKSQCSKRDGTAEKIGFNNFCEMYYWFYDEVASGKSMSEVSRNAGMDRHYVRVILKDNNVEKSKKEIAEMNFLEMQEEVRVLLKRNVSLHKIAEHYDIELMSARLLAGDFYETKSRKSNRGSMHVAVACNMTDTEYTHSVIDLLSRGYGRDECSNILGGSSTTQYRVFGKYLIENRDILNLKESKADYFLSKLDNH